MEIASTLSNAFQSRPLIIASVITVFSLLLALRSFIKKPGASAFAASLDKKEGKPTPSCNGTTDTVGLNGGASTAEVMAAVDVKPAAVVDRQTGASMMEQLVPEITTHALSYLDFPSLCRLSMTNSLMRKAANDDNAWKALYHKVRDVRARVLTDVAWVTMKTFVEMTGPFNMTNVFEFHNGRWYMVHHHSSVMLADGELDAHG